MAEKPTPARKGLPRWILIAGGLLVLLGAAAVAAPFFVPWDKLKDQLAATVSKSLGRELKVGKVEVGLFSGVHVRDISLANAKGEGFSQQPLFKVDDAKVSVSLLSILTGKLLIKSISFDAPAILIETGADGSSNLAGIGKAKPAPAAGTDKVKAAPEDGKGGGVPVVVAALEIKDGDLLIRDRKAKKPDQEVKGLGLRLYGLSLKDAGDSRLELDLAYETEGKSIPLSLVCVFSLDLKGDRVNIGSLSVKAPALTLDGKADVKAFSKAPVLDAAVGLALDLDRLPELLPPSALKQVPGGLKSGGKIKLDVAAKGAVAEPAAMDLEVQLGFVGVKASYGDYPALSEMNGLLRVNPKGAELPGLNFKLDGDPATLALKARWDGLQALMAGPEKLKADVEVSLKSPKLNLDPVIAIAMMEDTPAEAAAKAKAKQDHRVPNLKSRVPAGLKVSSLIEVQSLVAKTVKTGKLTQKVYLKDRKLQTSTDVALYDGVFWERTAADFNQPGPVFKGQAGLSKLDFASFLKDMAALAPQNKNLAELNGKLSGALGFKADYSGKGFTPGTRLRNLAASGSFYLKDGELKQTKWQTDIAKAIPHQPTRDLLLGDILFSNAVGEFAHSAERFTLKSFTLGTGEDWRGGDVLIQANGFRAADGTLDFKVVPHFNPTRVKLEGIVGDGFNDKAGWATYDYIAYYGPAGQAKADFKAGVQNAAKKAAQKKVDEVKQQAAEQLKQKAGDALKGLFGR